MNQPFREAFRFYTSKIEYMFLFAFTVVLPTLIFHSVVMNYVYAVTPVINNTTPGADLLYSFLSLILLTVAQVPIIRFVYNEQEGHERPVADAFKSFALLGFSIFLFALIYGLLTITGIFIFIIPGLIIMLLLFLTPYLSAMDGKPARKSWREALRLGKKHFLALVLIVGGIGLVEMFISIFAQFLIFSITSSYGAQLFSQMLLNMVVFPFVVVVVTMYVLRWRSDSIAVERG